MSAVSEAVATCLRHKLPLALRGRPGVGKTSITRATATQLGMSFELVIGSLREPTDLAGLPFVRSNETVALAPPSWAVDACKTRDIGHVILLDELTTATPSVQAAMLRIIQEGVVGELELPPEVRIVAAYNDADDCGGYELVLPMRSRLLHLDVTADVEAFTDALVNGWPVISPLTEKPDETRSTEIRSNWCCMIAAFLKARPEMIEVPPKIGSWGGYPTPRTWEMTINALTAAELDCVSSEVRGLLVEGCIGSGPAFELLEFIRNADLPDPKDILRDPQKVISYLNHERPDRAYAVIMGVAQSAIAAKSPELWTNSWKVAGYAIDEGFGDVLAWSFKKVPNARPHGAAVPAEFKRVSDFLAAV